jgi:predicted transcriptional regulator
MTSITIALPDDRLEQLRELAKQLNISTEELIRISIDELLSKPGSDFRQATKYVLDKNDELYRRLA